jgi:hypothetical protein
MPQTNAERQRAWRERHRGEPRGNTAMQAQLAVLQGRVAQLEVETGGYAIGLSQGAVRAVAGGICGAAAGARRTGGALGADRGVPARYSGEGKGLGGAG